MGIFTTVAHSNKWLSKHENATAPRFGWQTKSIGYGDHIRLTSEGKVLMHHHYADDWSPWIDVQFHGEAEIYTDLPDGRWVEYKLRAKKGNITEVELVYDGSLRDRFKLGGD